jgi:hypothetical protein
MPTTATTSTLETFTFDRKRGWSIKSFPKLNSDRTLVLVFGATSYLDDDAPLCDLQRAFPDSHIAGCSTAGEIHEATLMDECLCVAVMQFKHTSLTTVTAPVRSPEDSSRAGEMLAHQLQQPGLRGALVLSDGLKVNGSELVRGLNASLPDHAVVTGGLAGDGDRFKRTWVIKNGKPAEGIVSAVGFYGERVHIGHGSKGGWDVFGPERLVTRSRGNILFELDHKPALPLYKEYLGDRASELPASALLFPLALRKDAKDPKRLVRTVLSIDEAKQAMVFAGDTPEGYLAQLMRANFSRLIEGAAESALMTRQTCKTDAPCLAIAVSCVGRRLVLGARTEEELESTLEVLPAHSRQVGFYSYGEISPYSTGKCDLHNQTMTLTTIAEV